ncbi:hypothetical protein GLOIN_2v34165 [Rhizophagus irregularis DAOM 181602=DAOM 197198]|uniref:Uncharacterized protein n=1 Tax=Rhizophagus irregularis (strain DAOM 181602 / DAOM 197198 / MUCL 43194) TaxID=747089 RepID=A0A2P4Q278_RHIID|nr:hypothetical protein GLOIN_2v34165 [Rhizophagus irregularis DAOM 181602=DAOM 197198]POG71741.1 hypothetical protein GLOIN_2v34165 [Rhizophagus irregularis DAOM 181602=DAOM 197198]GET52788.1 hypothetical protein GLOIN_2v34165 [Rhizophagus irregularis DAOM 181602=DAOM 197198]|eukprot:XP_025178607.1 hypothetical protein GLOIN_2v34165 [Rhizophagus irregularis DAOM 181602=DAOM 197198]
MVKLSGNYYQSSSKKIFHLCSKDSQSRDLEEMLNKKVTKKEQISDGTSQRFNMENSDPNFPRDTDFSCDLCILYKIV